MKIKTLDEVCKDYILYVLNNTETKKEASHILGISPRTLGAKLSLWGIKYTPCDFRSKPFEQKYSTKPRCPHCGTTELLCGYDGENNCSSNKGDT